MFIAYWSDIYNSINLNTFIVYFFICISLPWNKFIFFFEIHVSNLIYYTFICLYYAETFKWLPKLLTIYSQLVIFGIVISFVGTYVKNNTKMYASKFHECITIPFVFLFFI